MKKSALILLTFLCIITFSCANEKDNFITENVDFAAKQTQLMLEKVGAPTGKNYPRTMDDNGNLIATNMYDWTPGFFPGSLWYLYELTGDTIWRSKAEEWTVSLESLKTFTKHHDLGFMIYCSYGNAERLASKPEYKSLIVESAESLSTRFSEETQSIKSWNHRKSWNDTTEWFFPVIADNMMNLEMLLVASKFSGNKKYHDVAVTHANTTIANHLREDYSSYHVVDYDTITGGVKYQGTCQGFSDNSTWSRGQAWIVYGFTMMYRETKEPRYLEIATKTADYFLQNLPEDMIPLWDFNVGQQGYVPDIKSNALTYQPALRDVSAGAIVCSALFELGELSNNKAYVEAAVKMLHSLASPSYRAELGTNADFLLMHSVGSLPHKSEIDKPLVYADYYFLEALTRYKRLHK